ncbi:hypothetical protein EGW08_007034, partial [Elysia chlorotica]
MDPSPVLLCSHCDFATGKERKMSKHMRKKHPGVEDVEIVMEIMPKVETSDTFNGIMPDPVTKAPKKRKIYEPSITMQDIPTFVKSEVPKIASKKKDIASPLEIHSSINNVGKSKKMSKNKKLAPSDYETVPHNSSSDKEEIPVTQLGHEKTFQNSYDVTPLTETQFGQKVAYRNGSVDTHTMTFTCPFCKSAKNQFPSLKALSAHKKTHHKEIVLNCFFCDFSSTVLRKWNKHLRKDHCENIDPLLKFLNLYIQQGN